MSDNCGFDLNLEPLSDTAIATLTLEDQKLDVSIKGLWEATAKPEADLTDSDKYIQELKPHFEAVIGQEISLWSTEIIYNAVTNWVTNLYKKK